jgi:hypothetical protein
VRDWLNSLIQHKETLNQIDGPAISFTNGSIMSTHYLDFKLTSILEDIYDRDQTLFPTNIRNNKDEIGSAYQVFRSLRRSSDTRAVENNVSRNDIDTVNRWHGTEQALGNRPHRSMYQHYAQVDLLTRPYLRYTKAM